ncbi:MAG: hypothetical protein PHY29_11225 [Syntrophales bacterium]|nr:hypothetical protein [Syntrophales bacterium]
MQHQKMNRHATGSGASSKTSPQGAGNMTLMRSNKRVDHLSTLQVLVNGQWEECLKQADG